LATKWEYQVIDMVGLNGSLLNGLGSSGWEVVSVLNRPATGGPSSYTVVFKRPLVSVDIDKTGPSLISPIQR
jgi:hypothetical protein